MSTAAVKRNYRRPERSTREYVDFDGTAALSRSEQLAYDLARFDRRYSVRTALNSEQAPVLPAIKARAQARPRLFTRVSFFAVASFMAVMTLLFLIVYSYVQINELALATSDLQKKYENLQGRHTLLLSQYEQRMGLSEVEDYARNKLGMVSPEQSQMVYFDLSGQDHAVVMDAGAGERPKLLQEVAGFVSGIFN